MRGAFRFNTGVVVANDADEVAGRPNSGVGEGPPVGVTGSGVGVTLGVASRPGVRVGAPVEVGVCVGCAVGITGTTAAPQLFKSSANNPMNKGKAYLALTKMRGLCFPLREAGKKRQLISCNVHQPS